MNVLGLLIGVWVRGGLQEPGSLKCGFHRKPIPTQVRLTKAGTLDLPAPLGGNLVGQRRISSGILTAYMTLGVGYLVHLVNFRNFLRFFELFLPES